MSNRPARSASIPIPRTASSTSPSRNLEAMLSIPFLPPPRPRIVSASTSQNRLASPEDQRGLGVSHILRSGSSSSAAPTASLSPTRSTSRSLTITSGMPPRPSFRTSTFEPRIVRGDSSSRTQTDTGCLPSTSTSVPSNRARRSSASGVRAPSATRGGSGISTIPQGVSTSSGSSSMPVPTVPSSFARPAYLELSALRHLLHTEEPPRLPALKVESVVPSGASPSPYAALSESDEESDGTPPRDVRATSRPRPPSSTYTVLPSRWSEETRHPSLTVSAEGRELTFQGQSSSGEKDAASARTTHPAPAACGIYYYEVEILNKPSKGCSTSIGFAGPEARLSRLPGSERSSWGYHGSDGYCYASEREGSPYGVQFQTGDFIGCGIDFTTRRMFFTRNGSSLGDVFDNVGKDCDLYPSVGMRINSESVRVNFGQETFKYDIEYHVQQKRSTVWNSILTTPISGTIVEGRPGEVSEEQSKGRINRLILSYLAHHGYARTARAFQTQIARAREGIVGDGDVEMEGNGEDELESEIEQRTKVVHAVMEGDIDGAIQEARRCYQDVLEMDDGLVLFKLKCRKFVELVMKSTEMKDKMSKGGEEDGMVMDIDDEEDKPIANGHVAAAYEKALTDAISYGQGLHVEYKDDERSEVQDVLKRTFGILAFYDPRKAVGSASEVVGKDARMELATEVNQAILKSQGKPSRPILETVYRHTAGCIVQLGLMGVGSAAFADMQRELLE